MKIHWVRILENFLKYFTFSVDIIILMIFCRLKVLETMQVELSEYRCCDPYLRVQKRKWRRPSFTERTSIRSIYLIVFNPISKAPHDTSEEKFNNSYGFVVFSVAGLTSFSTICFRESLLCFVISQYWSFTCP